jgi:hypothetical protein
MNSSISWRLPDYQKWGWPVLRGGIFGRMEGFGKKTTVLRFYCWTERRYSDSLPGACGAADDACARRRLRDAATACAQVHTLRPANS